MKPYYEEDGITIYCGDCRDVLPGLGKVDLVLTDPPYGIGACAGVGKYGRLKIDKESPRWDEAAPTLELFNLVIDAADNCCIWGGNYFPLPPSRCFLVWDKGAGFKGRNFAECEQAWCSWDGNAKLKTYDPLANGDYHKGKKRHPTQKPIPIMKWSLECAPKHSIILDPFGGVGTTAVAAKQLGRKAIIVELEEKYCDIAIQRLRQGVLAL